ncbi:MAG: hypothetical protein F4051_14270 [Boseongicola sp. SB0670_bin_30]|nr:hypothetical protein [Boseongicola sp. SB0670_bin_30]
MKALLDQCVSPRQRRPLQEALDGAPVESAVFRNWRSLADSEFRAHDPVFTVLPATDKPMTREQAPLSNAVIALDDNRWSAMRAPVDGIAASTRGVRTGKRQVLAIRAQFRRDSVGAGDGRTRPTAKKALPSSSIQMVSRFARSSDPGPNP